MWVKFRCMVGNILTIFHVVNIEFYLYHFLYLYRYEKPEIYSPVIT